MSLAVIASAAVVAIGIPIADPLIGLAITVVILRITWQSWRTVRGHETTRTDAPSAAYARPLPPARRRPESNRCKRLCRPLRNHSATSPGSGQA